MKILSLSIAFLLSLIVQKCTELTGLNPYRSLETAGFITTAHGEDKAFYLQDIEDGSVIELRFYFDQASDLNLDEFHYVEIKGRYSTQKNILYVQAMYPATPDKADNKYHYASLK